MDRLTERLHHILRGPLGQRSRIVLLVALLPLALSFAWPLWTIHMQAPQYPQGLDLDIYAYTVRGDIQEVNNLNHYIGMATIDRAALSDLDWIPFAIGALALLALRLVVIGDVRGLVDLTVVALYFCIFSAGRFIYKLYVYGHNLDPRAPFDVDPFMPPVLGTEQIANFTVTSLPGPATFLLGAFVVTLLTLCLLHLRPTGATDATAPS